MMILLDSQLELALCFCSNTWIVFVVLHTRAGALVWTGQIDYFNSEQYAKRLIGNAWSLPVVSIFFASLQSKFDRRDYPGYSDYRFAWEA
jgi:hypothetical protein